MSLGWPWGSWIQMQLNDATLLLLPTPSPLPAEWPHASWEHTCQHLADSLHHIHAFYFLHISWILLLEGSAAGGRHGKFKCSHRHYSTGLCPLQAFGYPPLPRTCHGNALSRPWCGFLFYVPQPPCRLALLPPPPTSVPCPQPLFLTFFARQTCTDSPGSPAAVSSGVCLFDHNTGKRIAHCQEQCGGTLCPVTSTTCLSKHSCSWVATVMKTPIGHESCPAPSVCCRLECSWKEYRNLGRRWIFGCPS